MPDFHCSDCGHVDITPEYTCPLCGGEDVFDKRLPEWPCKECVKPQALFDSVCQECQKLALGEALADFFGLEVDPFENPMEDYGAPEFRVFRGAFLR